MNYQLHMVFFSHESKINPVIDPQVFVSTPGVQAGTGPQMIKHVAGIAPAEQAGSATAPLRGADGSALKITLGEWEKAAGTVTFSCTDGQERAASTLTGLIPSGTYSIFVVHLNVQGAGRFTPWGNATGTNNNLLLPRQEPHHQPTPSPDASAPTPPRSSSGTATDTPTARLPAR